MYGGISVNFHGKLLTERGFFRCKYLVMVKIIKLCHIKFLTRLLNPSAKELPV